MIFSNLVDDLLRERKPRRVHDLTRVSKLVQAIVEPLLYSVMRDPSYTNVSLVLNAISRNPRVGRAVQQFTITGLLTSRLPDFVGGDIEDFEREENPEREVRGSVSHDEVAARRLKRLQEKWADYLSTTKDPAIMRLLLVSQLTNLKHLELSIDSHVSGYVHMATLLRLPYLEHLELSTDVGSEGSWHGSTTLFQVLESLISSTTRLKTLEFDDISGSISDPVWHNAPELKAILDKHAATTLQSLYIVLGMNDMKDWRMEQECTDIEGAFGTMKNYTQLTELTIQLEVLLGRPADGFRLRDVLPESLEYLTLLNLPDYHGQDDSDRVWEQDDYIPQFEDLAEAAACRVGKDGKERRYSKLRNVMVDVSRKDTFSIVRGGMFDEGQLGKSRIEFGWF